MKILMLVEDDQQERERAKEVITAMGFRVAVASNLQDAQRMLEQLRGKIAGIVTDLHFPEQHDRPDASKPCGLAVVAEAVEQGIPIAVCSNIDHHFAGYVKVVIRVFAKNHSAGVIPFVMDGKDWGRAVTELTTLLKGEQA